MGKRILAKTTALFAQIALTVAVIVMIFGVPADGGPTPTTTVNGDANGNGSLALNDIILLLQFLFNGGAPPVACAGGSITPEQEQILSHMSIVMLDDGAGNLIETIRIEGVNVQIVNGLGATNGFPSNPESVDIALTQTNGSGNLIIGYNELGNINDPVLGDERTGSHNLVVGSLNNYTGFGGAVFSNHNSIGGAFCTITGGRRNQAGFGFTAPAFITRGDYSNISGGQFGSVEGLYSHISGGNGNTTTGNSSTVVGGEENQASNNCAAVSGGSLNNATAVTSSVTGGQGNAANAEDSSVGGGLNRTALGQNNWVAGTLFEAQ